MLRKFLAGAISFVFVILAVPVTLILGGVAQINWSSDYSNDFFVDTHAFVVEFLSDDLQESLEGRLEDTEISEVVSNAISVEDVRQSLLRLGSSLEDLKVDETGVVEVSVPFGLVTLKQDEITKAIASKIYKHLPVCESDQLMEFGLADVSCVPEDFSASDFEGRIRMILDRETFSKIPDDLNLRITVPSEFTDQPVNFAKVVFGQFINLMIFILILLLIVMGLLIFRPFIRVLRWEFRTLFFAFFFSFLITGIFIAVPNDFLLKYCSINDSCLANIETLEFYSAMYDLIFKNISIASRWYLLGMAIIMLGFWILTVFYDKRRGEHVEKKF